MSGIVKLLDEAEQKGYAHLAKSLHPELPAVKLYPCISTVLVTIQEVFAPKFIPRDSDALLARAAAPLAGGKVVPYCGVLLGGMLAVGMKMGHNVLTDSDAWQRSADPAREFYKRFENEFGFVYCRDYSDGCDFDDPIAIQKWRDAGGLEKCARMLGKACRIVGEMLTRQYQ